MRIIGGEFKSRRLKFKCDPSVRPMTDRMRETLFNILGETVLNARVLDVFAGSGSIGLEALSRSASEVVFVELNSINISIIKRNLAELGLSRKAAIIKSDALKALSRLEGRAENFNLIFLDPPYNKGVMKKILPLLERSDILAPHARVIFHHSAKEDIPNTLTSLLVERSEKIGQARLSFLYRKV
ncbi:MAG: 16S rRNA (guanine(966)-N(2))-methyltransferase RsmD [Candidatus Omnitrophica bacterium]|nr:16S rRNA (guanine(966)-N(2))-methyltransferase RsmD [Candidatus Omnitrophota bacterium]